MLNHRRTRILKFMIAEGSAICLLLVAGAFALSFKPTDPTLALSINVATIAAAVAVVMIPIVYFGIVPVLPREGR